MVQRNLADPGYEPTDEELAQLMHGAFADVKNKSAAALAALRARIAEEQARSLARFSSRRVRSAR